MTCGKGFLCFQLLSIWLCGANEPATTDELLATGEVGLLEPLESLAQSSLSDGSTPDRYHDITYVRRLLELAGGCVDRLQHFVDPIVPLMANLRRVCTTIGIVGFNRETIGMDTLWQLLVRSKALSGQPLGLDEIVGLMRVCLEIFEEG